MSASPSGQSRARRGVAAVVGVQRLDHEVAVVVGTSSSRRAPTGPLLLVGPGARPDTTARMVGLVLGRGSAGGTSDRESSTPTVTAQAPAATNRYRWRRPAVTQPVPVPRAGSRTITSPPSRCVPPSSGRRRHPVRRGAAPPPLRSLPRARPPDVARRQPPRHQVGRLRFAPCALLIPNRELIERFWGGPKLPGLRRRRRLLHARTGSTPTSHPDEDVAVGPAQIAARLRLGLEPSRTSSTTGPHRRRRPDRDDRARRGVGTGPLVSASPCASARCTRSTRWPHHPVVDYPDLQGLLDAALIWWMEHIMDGYGPPASTTTPEPSTAPTPERLLACSTWSSRAGPP